MSGWDDGYSTSGPAKLYSILVIASRDNAGITSEELSFISYEDAEAAYLRLDTHTYKNQTHKVDVVRLYKKEESKTHPDPGHEAVVGS
jgi:hypothetical protein